MLQIFPLLGEAHTGSGLDPKAHDIYVILKSFGLPSDGGDLGSSELQQAASDIKEIYHSAPFNWHNKEQLRKELRGKVRRVAKEASIEGWQKIVPARIEEYAVKSFTLDQ